jgi:hypothetical protein
MKALNWINEMLAAGKTVYVCTMTRATVITPATARRWASKGHTLFKIVDGNLYMANGKKFVKLTSGDLNLVGFRAA